MVKKTKKIAYPLDKLKYGTPSSWKLKTLPIEAWAGFFFLESYSHVSSVPQTHFYRWGVDITKSHRFPHALIRETSVKGRGDSHVNDAPKVPFWAQTCFFFRWERAPKKTRGRMHFLGTDPKFQNVPTFQSNGCWLAKIVHFFTSYWLVAWWNVYVGYRIAN